MLYIVTLSYVRPIEEVNLHLESHKQWLGKHVKAGSILAAGPLEDRSGGVVLVHCKDRDELDSLLAQDSFVIERLVAVSVQGFDPVLRAESFAVR
ncbi:YciI family protein [Variovorax sp. tm]|uniref:YciI family protein n=1 Tax=Variovorax atrisoli TaxID=3394203 RepID=UPI003A80E2F1